ncbi:MAG: hypothetical protein Q4B64_09375 [Spirochaetales bacterium]|nr:hypothetical protein [Spirochaetales bacterium]
MIRKIRNLIFAAVLAMAPVNLFAQDVPAWFSEEVKVSEQEIKRKNSNNEYVPFIDKTFSACAFVKVEGEIYSLYDAQNKAEKVASEKLVDYLKKNKETKALEKKPEMKNWKFNDSLKDGGAYVLVQVMYSYEKPQAPKPVKDDKAELVEASSLSRIVLYGKDRLTMVDSLNLQSQESIEAHRVAYVDGSASTSKQSFYYPDGILVYDNVVELNPAAMQFNLKNVIKGRKTVVVVRVDAVNGADVDLSIADGGKYDGNAKVQKDSKNRWRNLVFEIPEGTITGYSPKLLLKSKNPKQKIGSITVYQLL